MYVAASLFPIQVVMGFGHPYASKARWMYALNLGPQQICIPKVVKIVVVNCLPLHLLDLPGRSPMDTGPPPKQSALLDSELS